MGEAATLDLGDQIAALAADLESLDGRELARRLQDLERLQRRLEHAVVGVVRSADRRGVWADDGHRSVRGWCQATVNWSYGDTTHRIRSVAVLDDLSGVDEAFADGVIGVAQVRELARARANPRCGDLLTDCEGGLLDAARQLPFDEFRVCVQHWEAAADADGAHDDHERTHENRRASFNQVGDGYDLTARGGVAQGATMAEIFDAFCNAEFRVDWDAARQRGIDDPAPADLARNARQRRFDALYAIFLAAASRDPDSKTPEPVVNIVVDQHTFEAALAAMAAGSPFDDVMPPVGEPSGRRCETIHGVPVDPCDAVTAAIIGQVRRVVYGARSCVIDLGVTSRLFRGSARVAVWLQGTRCIWPGCGLRYCEIDHSQPWNGHGHTNPANGAPLCGRHNRWKTRGYRTTRDADGRWHTYRPDGTEIRPL